MLVVQANRLAKSRNGARLLRPPCSILDPYASVAHMCSESAITRNPIEAARLLYANCREVKLHKVTCRGAVLASQWLSWMLHCFFAEKTSVVFFTRTKCLDKPKLTRLTAVNLWFDLIVLQLRR